MAHVDPASGDDSNDEPFDCWTEDIDGQHPGDHTASEVGEPWTGFTDLFRNPGYAMEKELR